MLWRQCAGRGNSSPGSLRHQVTWPVQVLGVNQCDGGGGSKEGAAGGHGKGVESWDFGAHKML